MSDRHHDQTGSNGALTVEHGNAICYSGYRQGQSPLDGIYPSHAEIREDLLILAKNWNYLRLYDCGPHAETVLDVIQGDGLDFRVMLGLSMTAEINNPQCPWGAEFSNAILAANRQANSAEVERAIILAQRYPDTIFSVSVGNEASVAWTDHMVPVETLIDYTRRIKNAISQPITFCENYVPWTNKLAPLAAELDFIAVHTYPVWEYLTIDDALDYTKQNYFSVRNHYPDKPVIITEAGWTTASNGRGIEPWNATEDLQAIYYEQLLAWVNSEKILTFVFEAFDETWKGSADPLEPEKHWGLFNVDRTPKLVMRERYANLSPEIAVS